MKILYVALVTLLALTSVGAITTDPVQAGPCDPNVQRC